MKANDDWEEKVLQGPSLSSPSQLLPQVFYRPSQPSISFCNQPTFLTLTIQRIVLNFSIRVSQTATCSFLWPLIVSVSHSFVTPSAIDLTNLLNCCHFSGLLSHPTPPVQPPCHLTSFLVPILFHPTPSCPVPSHLGNLLFSCRLN